MLPKQAIIPTTMNGAGNDGMPGATSCRRRHTPRPTKPPMNMPGPKIPPDPPDPIESEVARIFTNGNASTTHRAISGKPFSIPRCNQP